MNKLLSCTFLAFVGLATAITCGVDYQLGSICQTNEDCGGAEVLCEAPEFSTLRQCTAACSDSSECQDEYGEGECDGQCVVTCASDAECPDRTGCRDGRCVSQCSSDNNCDESSFCNEMYCEPRYF
jgi:hypothetical protein